MAYQTGTANTISDILDAIRVFAVAQGWTQNHWDGTWLCISSNGEYFNFHAESAYGRARFSTLTSDPVPGIRLAGATGYDSGSAWDAQPGTQAHASFTNDIQTPIVAYHLYGNANYVHCVLQINSNEWAHIPVGIVDKHAAFTGGGYACSTYGYAYTDTQLSAYNSFPFDVMTNFDAPLGIGSDAVHADTDGVTDQWLYFNKTYGQTAFSIVHEESTLPTNQLWHRALSPADNSAILLPIVLWGKRPDSFWSALGTVQDMRYVNMKYMQPGEVVLIGSDEWHVYPIFNKVRIAPGPTSGDRGFAYKKIV